MYRHPTTTEQEFPTTPREILNHSLVLLVDRFSERTVSCPPWPIWAYNWDGAGSERGGSAEPIKYEQAVFLPAKNDSVVVVSVGNREGGYTGDPGILFPDRSIGFPVERGYSVLLMVKIRPDLAEKILTFYSVNMPSTEKQQQTPSDYLFVAATEHLLQRGTSQFQGIAVFAYDSDFEAVSDGFFIKKVAGSYVESLRKDLEKLSSEDWHWRLTGSIDRRKSLSDFFGRYVEREEKAEELSGLMGRKLNLSRSNILELGQHDIDVISRSLND